MVDQTNRIVPEGGAKPTREVPQIFIDIGNRANNLLDDNYFLTLMTTLTIFALYGDDLKLSAFTSDATDTFNAMYVFCLGCFSFELFLSCVGKIGYFPNFYFWLDVISTLSLIPDSGLIDLDDLFPDAEASASGTDAIKAGRASKAARATRVIRLVRLVRMVRIVKLYKMHGGDEEVEMDDNVEIEPTKVGKKLNEMTTRKLIIMILTTIIILPLLGPDFWKTDNVETDYAGYMLHQIHVMPDNLDGVTKEMVMKEQVIAYAKNYDSTIPRTISSTEVDLIYLKVCEVAPPANDTSACNSDYSQDQYYSWIEEATGMKLTFNSFDEIDAHFHNNEIYYEKLRVCTDLNKEQSEVSQWCSEASFDKSANLYTAAVMNMIKTTIVMVLLVMANMMFSRDAQNYVLTPIERMISLITMLSTNPLASTTKKKDKNQVVEIEHMKMADEGYETMLLESTIMKIGSLLQIGFGAAGAAIIGKNMGTGELNPMVPGKMITSIYGFCDIRNFTDTTECLQEEVMVYVNKLGQIVHQCTNDYFGMANKNVGDAFLLSWKICDDLLPGFNAFEDKPVEETRLRSSETVHCAVQGAGTKVKNISPSELADSALAAFLKCLVDLDNANTAGSLTQYLSYPKVRKRFGDHFRIKMGFGMHVGWAIEGAIGSSYKIDATYMSPHVEMSDRLEAGSKIFGVPLNISHWLVALLSPAAQKFLRPMDKIFVDGCPVPMTVYTFDVLQFPVNFCKPQMAPDGETQLPIDFENDPQFASLQRGLHPAFLDTATNAVECYLAGEWEEARNIMNHALIQKPKDGPTLRLLGIMQEYDWICPQDWPGYTRVSNY